MLDNDYHFTAMSHAVLSSLACALPTMDPRQVRSMGISPQQAQRIVKLTTADMMRLATAGAPCITFQVDPEQLDRAIATIDHEADQQALIIEFIEQGASREMMAELFDVSHRNFARIRQYLGLPLGTGRPKECSPEDAERIFDAWQDRGSDRSPATILAMARDLDLTLRTIWDELDKYPADSQKPAASAA